jgi:four helix bundle protein
MPRDPRKLRVFALANSLVPAIYEHTRSFPADERFGLVVQMRRAAVSIPANTVEGCGRRKTQDYLRFLSIANGSAYELGYLAGLSARLGMMAPDDADALSSQAGHIAASLTALIESLDGADDEPRPHARAPRA